MSAILNAFGKVSNIRTGEAGDTEVVNFKLGVRTSLKNKDGKNNYMNYDCACWGALGTKLFLPYVKDGDYVFISGEEQKATAWGDSDKGGVNISVKVLTVSLVPKQATSEDTDDLLDTVKQATNPPNVSPAVTEGEPTIPF